MGKTKKTKDIKHYFASANSKNGFFSYFDYLNLQSEKGFLYILKGGPGTGKSTLMKKIGEHFFRLGFEIEYFHCSSDYSSLDGVRLVEHNIAIVDGTAPHVVEASMPGIKEKIINLGEFIDEIIIENEIPIRHLIKEKKQWFELSYSYTKAAGELFAANRKIYQNFAKQKEVSDGYEAMLNKLKIFKQNRKGTQRKLFQKAVAESGTFSYETLNNYSQTLYLENNPFICSDILDKLSYHLTELGYDIISFHELLAPEVKESVFIPQLDLFITQRSEISHLLWNDNKLEKELMKLVECNNETIKSLLKAASVSIKNAKLCHKNIEDYYITCMNFQGIDKISDKLIKEIKNKIID